MKKTVTGYHLGDRLDLKELKNNLAYNCIYSDPTELMYNVENNSYIGIFDYGSIVFFGVDNNIQTNIINSVRRILNLDSAELKRENFDVEIDPQASYKVIFDRLIIKEISIDIAKIIMLNIAQSVALDYYIEQSNVLLSQTYQFSLELEEKGKFSIKGKKLLKYIGRLLNLKNKIALNIYIFDSPNLTWNDEYLNVINTDLSRELDIKLRHSSLQDSLNTVRENLEILKDINQHSHSSNLELIVIVLIAIEIINLIIDKLL
jgi:required for meiotic nuclear division protein 1